MKKEIEYAYERLPKLLVKYGFVSAYIASETDGVKIILSGQKAPLSLAKWLEFETFLKLDITPNIIILGKEQVENLDSFLLIKAGE